MNLPRIGQKKNAMGFVTHGSRSILPLICIALFAFASQEYAAAFQGNEVAALLPDPDGKPGDASKPVKVYILAGQSNMVGMGDIRGARNIYSGIYYGSDPATSNGPMQIFKVGNFKTAPLKVFDAQGKETAGAVAKGAFEVPEQGEFEFQCGTATSSFCRMLVAGKEVYRREKGSDPVREKIKLTPGKKYSFEILDAKTGVPRFWIQKTDLLGNGDLEAVVKRQGNFPWLVDDEGNWTIRKDVYFQEARLAKDGKGSNLSATSNGRSIGPELGFGYVMGTFHDEQVLLIKTAQGNRSLGFDFRPPSSGRTDPNNKFESAEYKLMIEGVRKTLTNIEKVVPGYRGQGYELAGFVWFQGHKDSFSENAIKEYEKNLVNLIQDVRKEFKVPKMPAVIATVGFGGRQMAEKFERILNAQMAVGDKSKHPEFDGNVTSVDTRDYWREVDESPRSQDYHYHRNAETYMLIGDALGRAMVRLQGGKAASLPLRERPKRVANSPKEMTEEEKLLAQKAIQPILIDGIASAFVANTRNSQSLIEEASGSRPKRANQFLRGAMFGLTNIYRAAGVTEYDWETFGPDFDELEWDYLSFDPPETLAKEKGSRYRDVTLPTGSENWTAADFDPTKAGWRKGKQPFGQLDGKLVALSESCNAPFCRCGEKPKTLWEKEVLLFRTTVETPKLKEGHNYRIVVGGAAHVNSGEGFAIYINGKLLAESKVGVAVRQGGQPRGSIIFSEFREAFNQGPVTIAVKSFLRYNHPRKGLQPPRGHISIRMEEMKLPPGLADGE